jgi:cobalamin biosynthesis protein CobT
LLSPFNNSDNSDNDNNNYDNSNNNNDDDDDNDNNDNDNNDNNNDDDNNDNNNKNGDNINDNNSSSSSCKNKNKWLIDFAHNELTIKYNKYIWTLALEYVIISTECTWTVDTNYLKLFLIKSPSYDWFPGCEVCILLIFVDLYSLLMPYWLVCIIHVENRFCITFRCNLFK